MILLFVGKFRYFIMKILAVIFAQNISQFAFKPEFGGESAFEKSLKNFTRISGVEKILVLSREGQKFTLPQLKIPVEISEHKPLTLADFVEVALTYMEGFQAMAFGYGDTPFFLEEICSEVVENMEKYSAEYAFADGYPKGTVPEFLSGDALAMLRKTEKDNRAAIHGDVIFETIKGNINNYDVETVVSPVDYRHLRIKLACDTKRNFLCCTRLYPHEKNLLEELTTEKTEYLKTLPAFYNIQISEKCSGKCSFCPYPNALKQKQGIPPELGKSFMKEDDFKGLLKKIEDFSQDGVISLSLWGEATYHPQFAEFAQMVLENPNFSLLIETTGENLTAELIEKLQNLAEKAPPRSNFHNKIYVILSVDATTDDTYRKLHGWGGTEKVKELFTCLNEAFPHSVYVQFLRCGDNEGELQDFYQNWTKLTKNVIIQKYSDFCGVLEDKKVVDLRPLERHPCWHLRRDISVLPDGSVPLCRERLLDDICGNAFIDDLAQIWQKMSDELEKHRRGDFSEKCERCDEFYTFNF